jgi:hypothetical protein
MIEIPPNHFHFLCMVEAVQFQFVRGKPNMSARTFLDVWMESVLQYYAYYVDGW